MESSGLGMQKWNFFSTVGLINKGVLINNSVLRKSLLVGKKDGESSNTLLHAA